MSGVHLYVQQCGMSGVQASCCTCGGAVGDEINTVQASDCGILWTGRVFSSGGTSGSYQPLDR